jgi:hypothetical protein
VEDIDKHLSEQLKRLERETIEVLLSWENAPAPGPSQGQGGRAEESQGYLSTRRLVDQLDGLASELDVMEQWLSGKGESLKFLQDSMLEIEAVSPQMACAHAVSSACSPGGLWGGRICRKTTGWSGSGRATPS